MNRFFISFEVAPNQALSLKNQTNPHLINSRTALKGALSKRIVMFFDEDQKDVMLEGAICR